MARTGPRKRVLKTKAEKAAEIKAAAERAAARSEGKPVPPKTKSAIDPPIVPHEVIIAEKVAERHRKKAAARRGRKSRYTRPLGKAIAKMMVMGLTINRIGQRPLMPPASTIWTWVGTPNHPFLEHYARARESYYLRMADDIVEIADDSSKDSLVDITPGEDGKPPKVKIGLDREHIERTKLRIETRKWLLAKVLPKLFGDQAEQGDGGAAAPLDVTPPDAPKPTGIDHLSHVAQRYNLGGNRRSQVPVTIEGTVTRR